MAASQVDDPLSGRKDARLLLGMAVQPIVAGLLGFVTFPMFEATNTALNLGRASDPLDAAVSLSLGLAIAASAITLFVAFPIIAWRLNRGPVALQETLITGAAVGNVPLLVIAGLATITDNVASNSAGSLVLLRGIIAGSFFGIAGAAAFWVVAIRRSISDARHGRA
jgi:hypothetical protein